MSFFGDFFGSLGTAGGKVAQTLYQLQQEERLAKAAESEANYRDTMAALRREEMESNDDYRDRLLLSQVVGDAAAERRKYQFEGADVTDWTVPEMQFQGPGGEMISDPRTFNVTPLPFEQTRAGQEVEMRHGNAMELQGAQDIAALERAKVMAGGRSEPIVRIMPEHETKGQAYLQKFGSDYQSAVDEINRVEQDPAKVLQGYYQAVGALMARNTQITQPPGSTEDVVESWSRDAIADALGVPRVGPAPTPDVLGGRPGAPRPDTMAGPGGPPPMGQMQEDLTQYTDEQLIEKYDAGEVGFLTFLQEMTRRHPEMIQGIMGDSIPRDTVPR